MQILWCWCSHVLFVICIEMNVELVRRAVFTPDHFTVSWVLSTWFFFYFPPEKINFLASLWAYESAVRCVDGSHDRLFISSCDDWKVCIMNGSISQSLEQTSWGSLWALGSASGHSVSMIAHSVTFSHWITAAGSLEVKQSDFLSDIQIHTQKVISIENWSVKWRGSGTSFCVDTQSHYCQKHTRCLFRQTSMNALCVSCDLCL